jgi:hypothetical protein
VIPDGRSGFVPDPRITEYPGTMIRDWIMLCPDIPDAAYRAYSIIRAHIWEKDVKREVHLTQADIGEMINKSEERTRKILKPLLKVGLLAIAEKREWWEYNPKLKRRERRTMNIYAVMDFPPEGYDGPKSVKDFRDRFSPRHSTDRSETTGRPTIRVSAGQTDRSETTGRSSSQVSDVSAGQADRSKMTSPAVKNDRPYKNLLQGEGEEGDARARVTGDPSAGDEPEWGVQGGTDFVVPTLASAELVRTIASKALLPGERLTAEDHQRLATLVEAARPLVQAQPGLSWEEYEAWLRQGWVRSDGRRAFRSFSGALGWRLTAERVQGEAWAWACEQRGAQESSEARGERDVPKPRTTVHAGTCGRHKVTLADDGNCLLCTREEAEEARQREAERAAAEAAAAENANDGDIELDGQEDEAELEELSAETLASMYESLGGSAPNDTYLQIRAAMEANRAPDAANA